MLLALREGGVKILLGTDSPLLVPGFGVHQELDAMVQAGFTPYQALETGTRNVAQYFGTLDSTGTVAVGKRADLVVWGADPLELASYPEQVYIGGEAIPMESRQTLLRDRYLDRASNKPPAFR